MFFDQTQKSKIFWSKKIIIEKKNVRSGFRKTNNQFGRDRVSSGIKIGKIKEDTAQDRLVDECEIR